MASILSYIHAHALQALPVNCPDKLWSLVQDLALSCVHIFKIPSGHPASVQGLSQAPATTLQVQYPSLQGLGFTPQSLQSSC